MKRTSKLLESTMRGLKKAREKKGLSPEELDERLLLGPGWVRAFENGKTVMSLDVLYALLAELDTRLPLLDVSWETLPNDQTVPRNVYAEPKDEGVDIHFSYAKHDARYHLAHATLDEFESVIRVFRDSLARLIDPKEEDGETLKSQAVVKTFEAAVSKWPKANPSDLWWFLVYRVFCDPFNHPARYARLNFSQSWKRTGGWALEMIMVRHYQEILASHGISVFIAPLEQRKPLLAQVVGSEHRFEADKADVFLTGMKDGREIMFGVVHVKASFAERRTDDVPMSKALVDAGYFSPLWTMDCKSTPGKNPYNKGELGVAKGGPRDRRSAKRRDIEDDGYFSACFSYNNNTIPTPPDQNCKARIYVCDFSREKDHFIESVVSFWVKFREKLDSMG